VDSVDLNVECATVSHEGGPNFAEAWMFAVERAPVQALHMAPEIEASAGGLHGSEAVPW
jgi:hypothetical protein